jgi:hypothetical protein
MEPTCSYEISVGFQRTTQRYIPEDRTLQNHRCENLRSYMWIVVYWVREKIYDWLLMEDDVNVGLDVLLAVFRTRKKYGRMSGKLILRKLIQ